jgi:uncharacterized membrane protein YdbT with pleckstrin-like domain
VDALQRLSEMKLFSAMSEQDRVRWADKFRREHYHRGAVVIRQGDRAMTFYIVDQGELRATARAAGQDLPRAYFYPGDYFGETGLLTGQPRNATIDVLSDAEVLVLDKLDFDQLMEEYPDIRELLRVLGRQREEAGRTRFPWQQPGEVTTFFSIKHWIALLRALRFTFLLGILGVAATIIYGGALLADLPAALLMVISGTLLAIAVLLTGYHFLDWRNDHYIVTSLRVLHVERVLLLREDRDEAPIELVQDVQVNQEGMLANLLNFGDVIIQTAAATEKVVFADVPGPKYVRDALFAPRQFARDRERAEVRESIRQELSHRLNIPVESLEEQDESRPGDPATVAEKETRDAFDLPDWVRRAWQWLRTRFTFETWIISDGGNTITWRKNGWLLVKASLVPFFAVIVVTVLFLWSLSQRIGLPWVPMIFLLSFLPIFVWWFYLYWDWQNDIYQISGNRLIDLKKRPLFLEELRRETTLDRVQNIALSIPGPIAQLLNYGTVVIETAGETGAFRFEYVHNPRGVQEEIFNRRERLGRQQREAEMLRRHAEMAEWFEIYEELKQKQG